MSSIGGGGRARHGRGRVEGVFRVYADKGVLIFFEC